MIGIHDAEDFIPPNIFDATNYWYVRRVKNDEKLAGLQFAVRAKPDNYSLTNLVYLLMLRSSNLFLTAKIEALCHPTELEHTINRIRWMKSLKDGDTYGTRRTLLKILK